MVWFKNIKNIHGLVNIVKDWKKLLLLTGWHNICLQKLLLTLKSLDKGESCCYRWKWRCWIEFLGSIKNIFSYYVRYYDY